jgi:hypothetical protein
VPVVLVSYVFSVVFVAAAAFGGGHAPDMERRSHFGLRVTAPALLTVLMEAAAHNMDPVGVVPALPPLMIFLCILAIMLVPSVLFRSRDSPPGDDDDDGGSDPGQPPSPPDPPSGDLPLPDADPARWRVRDHDRPDLRDARPAGLRGSRSALALTSLGDQRRP